MTPEAARERSLKIAFSLGYPTNPNLPLLEPVEWKRSTDEIVDRALAMHVVMMCTMGFPAPQAVRWLEREARGNPLTPDEAAFLKDGVGDKNRFQLQIEGNFALAWAIDRYAELAFSQLVPPTLYKLHPDVVHDGSADEFRRKARLKPIEKIFRELDLAYCLHWAIRDAQLNDHGLPVRIPAYVVIERRRALEWLVTDDDWDDVSLDT